MAATKGKPDAKSAEEQLVTRSEAAAIAGVHYNTIRRKQDAGELSSIRQVGRRGVEEALIPLHEVEALRLSLVATDRGIVSILEGGSDLATAQAEIARLTARVEALEAMLEEQKTERDRLLGEILAIAKSR